MQGVCAPKNPAPLSLAIFTCRCGPDDLCLLVQPCGPLGGILYPWSRQEAEDFVSGSRQAGWFWEQVTPSLSPARPCPFTCTRALPWVHQWRLMVPRNRNWTQVSLGDSEALGGLPYQVQQRGIWAQEFLGNLCLN